MLPSQLFINVSNGEYLGILEEEAPQALVCAPRRPRAPRYLSTPPPIQLSPEPPLRLRHPTDTFTKLPLPNDASFPLLPSAIMDFIPRPLLQMSPGATVVVGIIGPAIIVIAVVCISIWIFHRSGCLSRRRISKGETDSDDEKKSEDGNLTRSAQSSRVQTDDSDKQPEPEADVNTLDVEVIVVEDEENITPAASTVRETMTSGSTRRRTDAASGIAGLTASERLSPRMTEAMALSVDQVPPTEDMVTYTTVLNQEYGAGAGPIETQPVVVALQTLRGSFALSSAAPASLRASSRKLAVDRTMASTNRDDLTEERRHDRPCMESPGREVVRVSSSGNDLSMARRQPGAATRAVWKERSSGVLEAKKVRRKMSPALSGGPRYPGARRPKRTCLADILDSKGDRLETRRNPEASVTSSMGTTSMSASSSSSSAPGTPGYSPGQSVNARRAKAYGNWTKVRRNHRNDRMSSARIPPMREQWWVEPSTIQEGVRDLIGGLRRSLMRQQL